MKMTPVRKTASSTMPLYPAAQYAVTMLPTMKASTIVKALSRYKFSGCLSLLECRELRDSKNIAHCSLIHFSFTADLNIP